LKEESSSGTHIVKLEEKQEKLYLGIYIQYPAFPFYLNHVDVIVIFVLANGEYY
jgi:hypothetical protein